MEREELYVLTIVLMIISEVLLLIAFIYNRSELVKDGFLIGNLDGLVVLFVIGISIVINIIGMRKQSKSFLIKFCPHCGLEIKPGGKNKELGEFLQKTRKEVIILSPKRRLRWSRPH